MVVHSTAFTVNKLVKKTIVIGLEIVIRKTEEKLVIRLLVLLILVVETLLSNNPLSISMPNIVKITELIIPNIFLNLGFSSSFPIPNIASEIYM